jgi:hypothetical protein
MMIEKASCAFLIIYTVFGSFSGFSSNKVTEWSRETEIGGFDG